MRGSQRWFVFILDHLVYTSFKLCVYPLMLLFIFIYRVFALIVANQIFTLRGAYLFWCSYYLFVRSFYLFLEGNIGRQWQMVFLFIACLFLFAPMMLVFIFYRVVFMSRPIGLAYQARPNTVEPRSAPPSLRSCLIKSQSHALPMPLDSLLIGLTFQARPNTQLSHDQLPHHCDYAICHASNAPLDSAT